MLHPIARGMQQGQTVLRRPRTAAFALLAGLASWAAQIGGIYAALAAADIHPTLGMAGPRLPRLDARAALPLLARQRRPLPGRRRPGARAGLSDRLPARARVRRRAAGDRGLPRRRPRLLSSSRARASRWPRCAACAATTRATPTRHNSRPVRSTAVGPRQAGHVPPRGGASGHMPKSICQCDGAVLLDLAHARRGFARAFADHALAGTQLPADGRLAPARTDAGRAGEARRRPLGQGAVPLAQGQEARAATTCAWRATGASEAACRRCTSARSRRSLLLAPGRWYWKVRATGKPNSRWSNIAQIIVRADAATPYPPTRPTRAARDRGGREQHHRHVRRIEGRSRRRALRAAGAAARCSHAAPPRPSPRRAFRAPPSSRCASAPSTPPATPPGSRPSRNARSRAVHRLLAPDAPGNMRAITVADTSVALAWDAASDPDGTVGRYAVYRNGVLLGMPHSTGFLARNLAPATPYHFTVAAIDGGGHRSPDSAVDTTTQAPLPATGPAYAYMLATTGSELRGHAAPLPADLRRSRRPTTTSRPTSRSRARTTRS